MSEVTDDKRLPKLERKRLQIVHAKTCRLVRVWLSIVEDVFFVVYAINKVSKLWVTPRKQRQEQVCILHTPKPTVGSVDTLHCKILSILEEFFPSSPQTRLFPFKSLIDYADHSTYTTLS